MNKYAAAKAVCLFFRPSATNPEVCAKWVRPMKPGAPPFCLADQECRSHGLRLPPRVDSDDDGEVE